MSVKAGTVLVLCALLVAFVQADITGRIVGGWKAQPAQFPYQISLRMHGEHICGGSIISEKFILTAAHCVGTSKTEKDDARYFSIRAGSNNRLHGGVVVRVKSITIHENYEGNTWADIAVLELEKPLIFSPTIQPIELSTEQVPAGSDVMISGWGITKDGAMDIPIELKYNTVNPISTLRCLLEIGVFSEEILCLSHPVNNGACSGDSGGPAAYNGRLVGVAGFVTPSCGTNNPDGYAKVSSHLEWINSIIA